MTKEKLFSEYRFKRWRYILYLIRRVLPEEIQVLCAVLVFRTLGESRWDKWTDWYYRWHGHPSVKSYKKHVRLDNRLPRRKTHHDWEANWETHHIIPEDAIRKAVEEREESLSRLVPVGFDDDGAFCTVLYEEKPLED